MARKTYPEEKILSVLKEVADGATGPRAAYQAGREMPKASQTTATGASPREVCRLIAATSRAP
jgi:hypothetical protein